MFCGNLVTMYTCIVLVNKETYVYLSIYLLYYRVNYHLNNHGSTQSNY